MSERRECGEFIPDRLLGPSTGRWARAGRQQPQRGSCRPARHVRGPRPRRAAARGSVGSSGNARSVPRPADVLGGYQYGWKATAAPSLDFLVRTWHALDGFSTPRAADLPRAGSDAAPRGLAPLAVVRSPRAPALRPSAPRIFHGMSGSRWSG